MIFAELVAANRVQVELHRKNKKNGSSPETREEHGGQIQTPQAPKLPIEKK